MRGHPNRVDALLEALKLEPSAKVAYYFLGKAYELAGEGQAVIAPVATSFRLLESQHSLDLSFPTDAG